MLENIFTKIAIGITAIATIVGGWFGLVPDNNLAKLQDKIVQLETQQKFQSLGAFYQVGGERYQLWGSGVTASATSVILQSLQMPVSNQELLMDDFGDIGYATIEPGSATKREFISFTGITQSGTSDQATLTGVLRGLSPTSPYTASTTLQLSHSGGSSIIFSNSPAYYAEFALRRNNELIWGDWTYSATNTPQYNSAPTFTSASNEFASVKFAEDQANAGAATAATTTAGIVQIATSDQLKTVTTTGSSGRLLVPYLGQFATSSYKMGATTTVVMTDTDGKLDQSFIDFSEAWIRTGTTTFNANIVATNASSTMATTSFNVPPYTNLNPSENNQLTRKSYVDGISSMGIFGDGSDGASTTAASITLTRDHYFTNWTINSGVVVTTSYRIFVSGTLTNNGTISNKGSDGVLNTGGEGAISSDSSTLGGGGTGGNGNPGGAADGSGAGGGGGGVMVISAKIFNNANGTTTVAGGKGGPATATASGNSVGFNGNGTTTAMGGNGGAGGAAGALTGGDGGVATTTLAKYGGFHSTPEVLLMKVTDPDITAHFDALVKGGGGGGGGAEGASGSNNGGGGGGGGGVMIIISTNLTSGTETVAGGTGGAGNGTGAAGNAGSTGTKITITP